MEIKKQEIEHIANLSMLHLSETEIEDYTNSMNDIMNMANMVNEINTDNIDPSAFALDTYNVFRKDEIKKSLDRKVLLQNAPSTNGEAYQLPSMNE